MALKDFILNDEIITCVVDTGVVKGDPVRNNGTANNADYISVNRTGQADHPVVGVVVTDPKIAPIPGSPGQTHRVASVKIKGLLRVQATSAYTAANFGSKITTSTTGGQVQTGTAADDLGFIVGGETIGTDHFWFVIYH